VTGAPDLAAPIAGWRVWRLGRDAGGPLLTSPMRSLTWLPRRATTATCAAGCEGPPGWDCRCGLYALAGFADLGELLAYRDEPLVLGCTALWGRVVEATAGWRAERAYPLVLFARADDALPSGMLAAAARLGVLLDRSRAPGGPDLCRALGERYGVPVHALPVMGPDVLDIGASRRESRRWRGTYADVLADRPPRSITGVADAVLHEAAAGLAARRLGDRDAEQRLAGAVDRLVAALHPEPPLSA
jgi:hypothetical protein